MNCPNPYHNQDREDGPCPGCGAKQFKKLDPEDYCEHGEPKWICWKCD